MTTSSPSGSASETAGPTGPTGLILLDKPAGPTSHDCVARVRRLAGVKRVGHAGTLDPSATGLLVLGVGRATRLLTHLVGLDKAYQATIRLGAATTTDDADGQVTFEASAAQLPLEDVRKAMRAWRGRVWQVPSAVSAIKVDGQRAYARVRSGREVILPARPVTIERFDLLEWRPLDPFADLDVLVCCSSGAYVRALARDLGAELGVGGHLTALRRLRVGPFEVEQARTLESLADDFRLWPMAWAARQLWPVRQIGAEEARRLGHGQCLPAAGQPAAEPPVESESGGFTAAGRPDGRFRGAGGVGGIGGGSVAAGGPGAGGLVAAIGPDGQL
ncbi:MAG: tRNA pseudouridine(55) synthase TruB, partial [Bifidobacteriaceae bacterium]|nr:tRNA pseudouridine(55) synthase TruB [Bifidobacteriaceae bacterium]